MLVRVFSWFGEFWLLSWLIRSFKFCIKAGDKDCWAAVMNCAFCSVVPSVCFVRDAVAHLAVVAQSQLA